MSEVEANLVVTVHIRSSFGELVGLLNRRSDPPDSGGTGLWTEADFGRIRIETTRAKLHSGSRS